MKEQQVIARIPRKGTKGDVLVLLDRPSGVPDRRVTFYDVYAESDFEPDLDQWHILILASRKYGVIGHVWANKVERYKNGTGS